MASFKDLKARLQGKDTKDKQVIDKQNTKPKEENSNVALKLQNQIKSYINIEGNVETSR